MRTMKKYLFSAILICMCFVLSISLFSCKKDGDDEESETSGTEGSQTVTEFTLFDGTAYAAKLVYSEMANDQRKEVSDAMKDKFGVRPEAVKDRDEEVNADAHEILLGDTNRSESGGVTGVSDSDAWFYVGIIGNKLVINGSNSYMLEQAVEYFIESYIADGAEDTAFVVSSENDCKTVWADYAHAEWGLYQLPYYKGENNIISTSTFTSGKVFTAYNDTKSEAVKVTSVSKTSLDEFNAYAKRLEEFGYTETDRNTLDDYTFVTLSKDSETAYIYFDSKTNRAKIVYDPVSDSVADVSTPVVTPESGEGAVFYQYGLNQDPYEYTQTGVEGYPNNGMMQVIKCADNSLIIIDGGSALQMSSLTENEKPMEELNAFLHEITGTEEGGKITIAAWILTHLHGDHFEGFMEFIGDYAAQYDLKAICSNVPYDMAEKKENGSFVKMRNYANSLKYRYPDMKEIIVHTGQQLQFADVTVQVLFTPEDALDPISGENLLDQFNDTSCIFKIYTKDMSMMILGDAADKSENYLIDVFSEETLKCDIVQVAHHANNGVDDIYDHVKASIYFVPQSYGGFQDRDGVGYEDKNWEQYIRGELLEGRIFPTYAQNWGEDGEMIFYSGKTELTVGLQVVDGKITVVYSPEKLDMTQSMTSTEENTNNWGSIDFA